MKRISEFIKWYLYITSSILIVVAISYTCSGMEFLPPDTLWNIMLSGFVTTLVTVLILFLSTRSKTVTIIKFLLHYLLLCVVMTLCGNLFGWISFNVKGTMTMAISVAIVYALAFGAYYLIDLKEAKDINRKLREKYGDE